MPNLNLGPGVPNNVNLSFTPTWLFTPNSSAASNVRLVNNGRNTVYVGQANVTTGTGFPIPPGSRPVELTSILTPLYAISAVQIGAVLGTITTTATAGTTVLQMSTIASTALTVGQALIIQSTAFTSNLEVVSVASTTSTANFTLSTAAVFAHDTTNLVYACTPSYGQLAVFAGTI